MRGVATGAGRVDSMSAVFIHPRALCESDSVGPGTRVWAFAHVMRGAVVGADCNVGGGVFIEAGAVIGDRVTIKNQAMIWDGVRIEDDAFIGPGAVFANDRHPRSPRMPGGADRYDGSDAWKVATVVRRGASLGAGAVVLPGVTVGRYACVGAGAVVTRDVAPHRLVVGNPARAVGWSCVCGGLLGEDLACLLCGSAHRLGPEGVLEPGGPSRDA